MSRYWAFQTINAATLTAEAETARWFEALLAEAARIQKKSEGEVAKASANWLLSELYGALNRLGKGLDESPVNPERGAELLALVADGTISGTIAKQVFEIMLETGDPAGKIVEEKGTQADQRYRRHRGRHCQRACRQCRQGGAVQGRQGSPVRLLRRSDDEGHAGQGQSGNR